NGFFYILDRLTGRFLNAVPFAHQTWAEAIDANGRPILRLKSTLSQKGELVYPSMIGATNWWSPSVDPALGLIFVPMHEQGMVFFSSERGGADVPPSGGGRSLYTAV